MFELDHVESSFAAFVLAHKRLRLAQFFRQVDLTKTGLGANLPQQPLEPLLAAGVKRLIHRQAAYSQVAPYAIIGYGR